MTAGHGTTTTQHGSSLHPTLNDGHPTSHDEQQQRQTDDLIAAQNHIDRQDVLW